MALVGVDRLERLLLALFATSRVRGIQPASALLVAPKGSGKTSLLQGYDQIENGIIFANSMTPYALQAGYGEEIFKNPDKYSHLVVPDFYSLIAGNKDARTAKLDFLNSLIEIGIVRIASMHFKLTPEHYRVKLEKPIAMGVIGAMSTEDWFKHENLLRDTAGFIDRMFIISYHYSDTTRRTIRDAINVGSYIQNGTFRQIPLPPRRTVTIPLKIAEVVDHWDEHLAQLERAEYEEKKEKEAARGKRFYEKNDLGVRSLKRLRALALSIANLNGHEEVTIDDMVELKGMLDFFPPNPLKPLIEL